jgi:ISXO2-like transposase domain
VKSSKSAIFRAISSALRRGSDTQSVDGFFSLLKRGVVGTFHHISEQNLPLYVAEFDHRHNTRFLTDGERTVIGLQKTNGKRLLYNHEWK